MQIPWSEQDYKLYLEWTKGHDARRIAFLNSLYRVKTGGHIQAIISGEYNHGKSTTALVLMHWDTVYTRQLLALYKPDIYEKVKDHLVASIKDSVIISPRDPASKYVESPQMYRPYEIDEGYLFATTQEASSNKVKRLRDLMMQNRKLSPSFYHVYPNIFKMPTILLEQMMEVIHKINVQQGIVLVPSTVIQLKAKFNEDRIAKYAKYPKYFPDLMIYHPAYITTANFPRLKGKTWERYLAKYEKYKITANTEKQKAESFKQLLFEKLNDAISRSVIKVETKSDITKYIQNVLEQRGDYSPDLPGMLADEFNEWRIEKASKELAKELEKHTINFSKLLSDAEKKVPKDSEV